MEKIKQLLESEDAKKLIEENQLIIEAGLELVEEFKSTIKEFVMENLPEFIGENLDDTIKNIRVFAEVTTAQYMYEISNLCGAIVESLQEEVQESEEKEESSGLEDYI